MSKFQVKAFCTVTEREITGVFEAKDYETCEAEFADRTDIKDLSIVRLDYLLDSKIAKAIQTIERNESKVTVKDPEYRGRIFERLHAARHYAEILGTDTQASLEHCLSRIAESDNYFITGITSSRFALSLTLGSLYGGLDFNRGSLTWSINT